MPSICLSSAMVTTANCGLWALNIAATGGTSCSALCTSTIQTFATCGQSSGLPGGIRIMKGALPVGFSELTTNASRSSDTLIDFTTNAYSALAITNSNPNQLNFYPITAAASGVATWFWAYSGIIFDPTCSGRSVQYNRLWGTVGLQGSGADLEISDTNIVAGSVYKILNLRIGLPQSYTY